MKSDKILVGIDPDCKKNGVSIIKNDLINLYNLTFFELFEILSSKENFEIYIECGFLNKSNWHKVINGNPAINANIGQRTGANHEIAKKICEMCDYLGLKYFQIKPTKHKLNATDFKKLTKIQSRTNQEQRDSFMLIFGRK